MRKIVLIIVSLLFAGLLSVFADESAKEDFSAVIHVLTADIMTQGRAISGWTKFYEGDILEASQIDFDDSGWSTWDSMWKSANNMPSEWTGVRWYRHHLEVDSTLFDRDVVIASVVFGAAEIWLNGELVYVNGVVSGDPEVYERGDARIWVPVTFGDTKEQVLAVRFANANLDRFKRSNFGVGMNLRLHDVSWSYHNAIKENRFMSGTQWFITGFCVVFAIIHFLFFLFNRRLLFNLWFAMVCTLFGFGSWVQQQFYFYQNVENMMIFQMMMQAAMLLAFAFMSLFLHSVLNMKKKWIFYSLFSAAIGISIVHVILVSINPFIIFCALFLGLYILYISIRSIWMKLDGAWLLGGGVIIFVLSIFLVIALEMSGRYMDFVGFSVFHAPYLGFGVALVAMSVYQSRRLAMLNLDLLRNLREVKDLSEKNLENERSIREAEIQRARLETENERKTAELENARFLQLSMLPAHLPKLRNVELHGAMFTATEVGGDYYDVILKDDTSAIFAIGDATGHGTEAGFVVAMTKTLFQTLAPLLPADECLRKMSATLKDAGLRKKYMCLGLLHVHENKVEWCAAGIPAGIIYRAKTGTIEWLESKGMPLGSVTNFPYQVMQAIMEKGDILVLMSDGLPEQRNPEREQMGMERISDCLTSSAKETPPQIIQNMMQCMAQWSQTEPQHDDVTLLCLKWEG